MKCLVKEAEEKCKKRNFSKEHKKNLSKAWDYDKHFTEQTRKKISESHKGRKPHKFSMETRKKMSLAKIGKPSWNFGLKGEKYKEHYKKGFGACKLKGIKRGKMSEEHRRKVTLNHARYWKGKTKTEEQKRKVRETCNKEAYKLIARERRKKQVFPVRDTSIELKIQELLSLLHLEFVTHKYISEITHGYQCDIFIPVQNGIPQKTIIECDGCFYHCCPICKSRFNQIKSEKFKEKLIRKNELDVLRTKELQDNGFRVIRLWEHEINKIKLEDLKQKVYFFGL